jgi:epoxyqueuosine reductase
MQGGGNMVTKNLYLQIESAGFRIKTFKVEHLEEISTGFEKLVSQGLLDENFYKRNLTSFNYDYKSILKNAKSVIVFAAPQYKSLAKFEYEGKTVTATIPPTYISPSIDSLVLNILNDVLIKSHFSFVRASLPLKLLAVKSGLGEYGRNNVCYIPGRGSYNRLLAFITDYEFHEDSWGGIKAMENCSTCFACANNCPTGAIDKEQFLIHAQNCITNFNEYEPPIPEWIKPDWHNSIIGCMKCQTACPQNNMLLDNVDKRIYFDENETKMILGGSQLNELPEETRNKITFAGMDSYYSVLPRNLRLLIDKM